MNMLEVLKEEMDISTKEINENIKQWKEIKTRKWKQNIENPN